MPGAPETAKCESLTPGRCATCAWTCPYTIRGFDCPVRHVRRGTRTRHGTRSRDVWSVSLIDLGGFEERRESHSGVTISHPTSSRAGVICARLAASGKPSPRWLRS
eukprot:5718271-Prymnesium_polylepis.2